MNQEAYLVDKAVQGDKNAFCDLYNLYKNRLYRYAYYRLQNPYDAEDAVSDCVLSAYKNISTLKKKDAFSSWIFKILYCSCNAIIKKQIESRNADNIDDFNEKLSVDVETVTQKSELLEALAILKDDEREIVLLSTVAGFNSSEIAKICDMASGSVRSKLSRSLKKMRNFLE
jgi:RNA polymerase sigma-70 factor (ECF subfamily)